jgi:threonine dehydratase
MPTEEDLHRARGVVRDHLTPTPLVPSDPVGALLKLECAQPTGSFKVRGALAALSALDGAARAAGVVAASTGNHGLGVGFAAARLGIAATVVVPETASPAKLDKLRRSGVRLIQHGDGGAAAEAHALELAADGLTYVSPYNDPEVIAGQSTIGGELREQVEGPFTLVVPVGGGGLASGLALWAAGEPDVRVVGVEAAASRPVAAAVAAGHTVTVPVAPTLADALAGNLEPDSITPAILAAHEVELRSVTEPEIRAAMRLLATEHGLVVEGGAAVAVAALLAGKVPPVTGQLVALVTGRNVALPVYAEAVTA